MLKAVKGMNDVLPGGGEPFLDTAVWQKISTTAAAVLQGYGYHQVWLPLVEETPLFARSIGDETDIVSKEMYSFTDRGGRALTLRPEGTAGAARAYIEHRFDKSDPVQRWWYWGPMFRAERPQKGRYRQFYQFGAEFFGVAAPVADAEMLEMLWQLCARLGLTGVEVRLNCLGDAESRDAYREVLKRFLAAAEPRLCESCQHRSQTNPLRVLDCKRETCRQVTRDAPDVADSLSQAAREHFTEVQSLLEQHGVACTRDRHLVRGLDYYSGTIFEFTTDALGAQDAILGGGRYDGLVSQLGGPSTPAIGFAAGIERLATLLAGPADKKFVARGADLYVIPMEGYVSEALKLAEAVRSQGAWRVEVGLCSRRLKQQMRRADRSGARAALVLGENEVRTGRGALKDLRVPVSGPEQAGEFALTGPGIAAALSLIRKHEEE